MRRAGPELMNNYTIKWAKKEIPPLNLKLLNQIPHFHKTNFCPFIHQKALIYEN
jgi:hypothetical protein